MTSHDETATDTARPLDAEGALQRMTAMQSVLEQVERDGGEFADLAERLAAHFTRVDGLRDYLDAWMEDREAILGVSDPDGVDLPILGEDPLWQAVEDASHLVRRLLTVCAAEVAAESSVDEVVVTTD